MTDPAMMARLALALGETDQSDKARASGWQKLAGNHGRLTNPWPGLLTGEGEGNDGNDDEGDGRGEDTDANARG